MHLRRYYTTLAAAADLDGSPAAAGVALGMRARIEGTPHDGSFPHREELVAAGYPCREDLPDLASDPDPIGAREALVDELVRHGLSPSAAARVVASL